MHQRELQHAPVQSSWKTVREGLKARLFDIVFLFLFIDIFRVHLECVILSPWLDFCLIFHILTHLVLDRLYPHSKLWAIRHQFLVLRTRTQQKVKHFSLHRKSVQTSGYLEPGHKRTSVFKVVKWRWSIPLPDWRSSATWLPTVPYIW